MFAGRKRFRPLFWRLPLPGLCLAGALFFCFTSPGATEEQLFRFRLTSLFQPDRVEDFRALVAAQFPFIKVDAVDFETATVTLRLDPLAEPLFRGADTAEKVRERLSSQLRAQSRGAFDVLPLSEVPPDQLGEATIPAQGLDCKGCAYGAYRAVARIDGVEYATVSFPDGAVRVRFDRRKTNVAAIEEALAKARFAAIPVD